MPSLNSKLGVYNIGVFNILNLNDAKVIVYIKYNVYNKADRGLINKEVSISGVNSIDSLNYIIYKRA
jgi:hypothetical protein